MAEFQNTIDLLGDEVVFASLIDRSIVEFCDDVLNEIGARAFYASSIQRADLPNVLSLAENAFGQCKSLININIPKCVTIADNAFINTKFQSIYLPSLETLGKSVFSYCSSLSEVDLPKVTILEEGTFERCETLSIAKLNSVETIKKGAFNYCSKLTTLVLKGNKVVTLPAAFNSTFSKTPFATGGTGGTVYVPQELITEYQNATNWSVGYAAGTCNFVAIEGSEYE